MLMKNTLGVPPPLDFGVVRCSVGGGYNKYYTIHKNINE